MKIRQFFVICLLYLRLDYLPIRNPLADGFFGTGGKNFFLVLFLETFVVGEQPEIEIHGLEVFVFFHQAVHERADAAFVRQRVGMSV